MRTVAGDGWEASSARVPAALAAVLTTVGLSLSIAAPEVKAGDAGRTGLIAASAAGAQGTAVLDATLGGLASRRPSLRLDIATYGSFPVTALKVALPRGLAFGTKAAELADGISITANKSHTRVRKGKLTVTLRHPTAGLKLRIGPPAMRESGSLARAVRRVIRFNESHPGRQRSLPLKLIVTIESGGHAAIELPDTIAFR